MLEDILKANNAQRVILILVIFSLIFTSVLGISLSIGRSPERQPA